MVASNAVGVGKNCDSRPISGYRIDDCWTCEQQLRLSIVQFTAKTNHASVNLCLSQPAWTTTTKRTERNLIVRSGKSEPEVHVTNNRRLRSTYCKGKGKGLDTCYSATYMSQTRDQQRFPISEVAADWHEPMVPQRIMWPSIARANGQLDPRCS